MGQDELQKHLDASRYGSPQINPDEQKKYLGTFRERCFLSMTVKEMRNKENEENLLKEIKKEPTAHILINGAIQDSLQQRYLSIVTKEKMPFTIVSDTVIKDETEFGLLVVSDHAINEPVIDIEKKYPVKSDVDKGTEKEKTSLWRRLFE